MILALRNWRTVVSLLSIGALAVLLIFARIDAKRWRKHFDQEAALHQRDLATVQAAAEKARADDLSHAALVKARDDATAKEMNDALSTRLADARRTADAYAAGLREARHRADQGSAGGAYLPAVADAAGKPVGPGEETQLDDARFCAENTVKAEGWREWWNKVSAAPR